MKNPLLSKWNTPFSTVPFSTVKAQHFLPAIEEAIKMANHEISSISDQTEPPTFQNTIVALERSGHTLDLISSVFFNLHSAETNDEIQNLAEKIAPLITQHSSDILLNETLFKRIKKVKDLAPSDLSNEQKRLLEKTYKGFVRNGALLNQKDKNELRRIDEELTPLKLGFGNRVLKETQKFEKHIEDEIDLSGLPDFAREMAREAAKKREKTGWVFTLDYPSYSAVLKYADNRQLRQEMHLAFNSKASKKDDLDNRETIQKIAHLRHKRAELLGYASHAAFVLEERMAKTPETVIAFLNDLLTKAKPVAEKELNRLIEFAEETGFSETFQSFDSAYYSEKLKQKLFQVDDEALKPYFELNRVLEGAFEIANKLYGLTFSENPKIEGYHAEVKAFEVKNAAGNHQAILYTDFFPRDGKRAGAWMTSFQDQFRDQQGDHRPHISIVCNFSRPTKSQPSLLTFNEVLTLFHEFGHALHGMLSDVNYASLSGTHVYWDFVELPSQIMENWCYEKEALDGFARHFQTGKTIPLDLIDGIKKSSTFMEANATLRQLGFGYLDLAWHNAQSNEKQKTTDQIEIEALSPTRLLETVEGTLVSTQFSHIFQGGYAAGYYSYKWSEVLDADAFESFKTAGLFDHETASRFKKLLSSGGSEDPMALYLAFKGRPPKTDALLKRAGIE